MDAVSYTALGQLNAYRRRLTPQQYKTLRGQILAGNTDGAMRGLQKLLERRQTRHERTARQGPGHSNRQQPKD